MRKVKASLEALQDLEDSQLETTLLRSCLTLPRVAYVRAPNLPLHSHYPGYKRP